MEEDVHASLQSCRTVRGALVYMPPHSGGVSKRDAAGLWAVETALSPRSGVKGRVMVLPDYRSAGNVHRSASDDIDWAEHKNVAKVPQSEHGPEKPVPGEG